MIFKQELNSKKIFVFVVVNTMAKNNGIQTKSTVFLLLYTAFVCCKTQSANVFGQISKRKKEGK